MREGRGDERARERDEAGSSVSDSEADWDCSSEWAAAAERLPVLRDADGGDSAALMSPSERSFRMSTMSRRAASDGWATSFMFVLMCARSSALFILRGSIPRVRCDGVPLARMA